MSKFTEIERVFHVRDGWQLARPVKQPVTMKAVYLSRHPERTVRVRIEGDQAVLTIKGKKNGAECPEFNIPMSLEAAEGIIANPSLYEGEPVVKVRHYRAFKETIFEVDVFVSPRNGYVRCEVELSSPTQPIDCPYWLDEEITGQYEHSNSSMAGEAPSVWDGSIKVAY